MTRKKMKQISAAQARRGIYIDFEKRAIEDEAPVMLGVLFDPGIPSPTGWTFVQYVFDESLWPLADAVGSPLLAADMESTLARLVDEGDIEGRHLISWSTHDDAVIKQWSDRSAYRYRNAITAAKKLKGRRRGEGDDRYVFKKNALSDHLAAVGYEVPDDSQEGAGTWINNVRKRLASGEGTVADLAESGRRDWARLSEHNLNDVYGMCAVVHTALGLDDAPVPQSDWALIARTKLDASAQPH